ncbi:hypothetical protein [Klebsiella phage 05F01]|nr:hypothetical protein [Klebsiella phage 05F01]
MLIKEINILLIIDSFTIPNKHISHNSYPLSN